MKRFLSLIVVLAAAVSATFLPCAILLAASASGCRPSRDSGPPYAQAWQHRQEELAVAALAEGGVPLERDRLGRVRWIEAGNGELTDGAMRHVANLPMLEWLEIGGGTVTAAGAARLKACTRIRRLYLHKIRLGDDALSWASGLVRLEALSLQGTGITGKALRHLGKAANTLTVLNLSDNDISDADMDYVVRFPGLEVLALQNTKVTGAGLARLKGMANLNVLNLAHCAIVDGDLEHFAGMPNLRIVHAAGCRISDEAIGALNAKLPMLSIFR